MALKKFGDPAILAHLMPGASKGRPIVKFTFMLLAITGVILIIARPQFGAKYETVKRQGVEVVIALDVSNSMLAEDVQPNRLERSKQLIYKLLEGMNNDKLGIIVFAGKSYIQLPMTSDYQAAKMYIDNITPNLIPQQGTAIGAAINMSVRSFSQREEISRMIIVITDGENHEDDAVGAAKAAQEAGIQVNVIGMGKPEGAPIPIQGTNSFRKDKSGMTVISKLNGQIAQEIAAAGGGIYVRADNSTFALKEMQNELNKASKSDIETKVYSEYNEQFPVLAWIVLILLLFEFCILERRNKFFSKIKLFS
jgi:Ca-activated chloride channel family protein